MVSLPSNKTFLQGLFLKALLVFPLPGPLACPCRCFSLTFSYARLSLNKEISSYFRSNYVCIWGCVCMSTAAPRAQKKTDPLELEWWLWASQVSVVRNSKFVSFLSNTEILRWWRRTQIFYFSPPSKTLMQVFWSVHVPEKTCVYSKALLRSKYLSDWCGQVAGLF